MEHYLSERSIFFNAGSEFSCPDSCGRYGCKEPDLHIFISVVDLVAISLTSGRKASDLFKDDCKMGFDPVDEGEPWIGRLSIELKKPCHFLDGKKCNVYPGRPIACALFPEYCFIVENSDSILQKEIFRNFPCIQKPCFISPCRRERLQKLMEMSIKETFLSDFYLFGISPFLIDLKNIAGEGLEGLSISEEKKTRLPHHRIEALVSQRLHKGGYLNDWETKIGQLDRAEGLDGLAGMRRLTDEMVIGVNKNPIRIAYQFNGNKLLPIHFNK